MNKLLWCPLIAVSLFLSQCSQTNNDNPTAAVEKTTSVQIAIKTAAGFDKIASGALARVSAPDMKEINCKLTVGSTSISGTITGIPVGTNRLFEVIVYDTAGGVIYTGSSYADIDPIQVADVVINLKKFSGGSATIHGSLVDLDSPCTSIWFTTLTGFVSDYLYDEKKITAGIIAVGMSSHYRSYNPDTFEFYWEITGKETNVKTDWAPATQDPITSSVKFSAAFDDKVIAIVHARCLHHPQVIGVDTIICLTGHGAAEFHSNNIYPYTYSDTVDFDMSPTEIRKLSFKKGDAVYILATGSWCVDDNVCWSFPIESKDGPAAGKKYLYPDLPAAACLIDWDGSGYGPHVFNGGDNWTFDQDQGIILSGNTLTPDIKGSISGKIHIHYVVRGGMVEFPKD